MSKRHHFVGKVTCVGGDMAGQEERHNHIIIPLSFGPQLVVPVDSGPFDPAISQLTAVRFV